MDWTRLTRVLIADGLLDAQEVIDGDVVLREASGRNTNVVVIRKGRSGYFIKDHGEPGREAACYALLGSLPGLGGSIPTVARADLHGYFVLHSDSEAIDLLTYHRDVGGVDAEIGRAVGRALAVLHRETRVPAVSDAPDAAPGALSIHRPTLDAFEFLRPASLELAKILQGQESLAATLDALRETWRLETLIHGDVKWVNILVIPPEEGRGPTIRLIDWEEAGEGEPAWDLGSALAGYVVAWIDSIPAAPPGTSVADQAELATVPLHRMHASIGALWDGYLATSGVAREAMPALRRRSVSFSAVRLIRTAFEETEARSRMSRRVVRLLQVAANILDDPEGAAERLLGLPA